jgi:anti-sigma B factor antagonist
MMEITETKHGKAIVLAVKGRLDTVSSNALQERWLGLIQQGSRWFVLDGSELVYVSSSGLRILLVASKLLNNAPGGITVCGLRPGIQQIFDVTGFANMFPITASLDEALRELDKIA